MKCTQRVPAGVIARGCLLCLLAGCQNGPTGGAVVGPIDNHCYVAADGGTPGGPISFQTTSESSCNPTNVDAGPPQGPAYGPTAFNSASNDDDCKYQVGWWSTPIQQNTNVTFYVSNVHTADGTPLTGAASGTIAEVFLNDHHPAPNSNQATTELTGDGGVGVYAIGPVRFDAPGVWQVRFHFREDCEDLLPDSPHGHAAFYVNVP